MFFFAILKSSVQNDSLSSKGDGSEIDAEVERVLTFIVLQTCTLFDEKDSALIHQMEENADRLNSRSTSLLGFPDAGSSMPCSGKIFESSLRVELTSDEVSSVNLLDRGDHSDSNMAVFKERIGLVPPEWIPDEQWRICMSCSARFTLIKRRHHCRACGRVLCCDCCHLRVKLQYLENKKARVCQLCASLLDQYDSQQGSAEQISSDVLRASCVLKKSAYPKAQSKNVTFEDGVCPGEVDSRRVNMFADSLSSSHTVQPKNDKRDRRSREKESLLPNTAALPPSTFQKCSTELQMTYTAVCRDEDLKVLLNEGKEVVFHIKRNLCVNVKLMQDSSLAKPFFWRFISNGFCNLGISEKMFFLERTNDEILPPRDMFLYYNQLYNKFLDGELTNDSDCSFVDVIPGCFPFGFLGNKENAAVLFFRPNRTIINQHKLPKTYYHIGLLVHRSEMIWAEILPLRLLLRFGFSDGVYPWSVVSSPMRCSFFGETGHTVMSLLNDMRNFTYTIPMVTNSMITVDKKLVVITIAEDSYQQDIDSGTYVTKRFSKNRSSSPEVTGSAFIIFNASLKSASLAVKNSIVEDGVMVQIHLDNLNDLRECLRNKKDYFLKSNEEGGCSLEIRWDAHITASSNFSIASHIDSYNLDLKYRYLLPFRFVEAYRDGQLVRLTDVFTLPVDVNETLHSEPESFAASCRRIASATCKALLQFAEDLLVENSSVVSLRLFMSADVIDYKFSVKSQSLLRMMMAALDDAIVSVLHLEAINSISSWKAEFIFRFLSQIFHSFTIEKRKLSFLFRTMMSSEEDDLDPKKTLRVALNNCNTTKGLAVRKSKRRRRRRSMKQPDMSNRRIGPDAIPKLMMMRHGERLDSCRFDIRRCFESGSYTPLQLNHPSFLPTRGNGQLISCIEDWVEDTPLSNMGRAAAFLMGRAMAREDEALDYVFASPAHRCVETADEVVRGYESVYDLLPEYKLKVKIEDGLFEFAFGKLNRVPPFLSLTALKEQYCVDENYVPFFPREKLSIDESYVEFVRRTQAVVEHFARFSIANKCSTLLVSHAPYMDALTSLYKGGEPRDPNDWIHLVQNTPYLYMRAVKWNGKKWQTTFFDMIILLFRRVVYKYTVFITSFTNIYIKMSAFSRNSTALEDFCFDSSSFSDEIESHSGQIVLCIYLSNQKLGAAYYDTDSSKIFTLNDVAESMNEFSLLIDVLNQVRPTTILLSSKADERLCKLIDDFQNNKCQQNAEVEEAENENDLIIVAASEFELSRCKNTVERFISSIGSGHASVEDKIRATLFVDMESVCMIRALGVLINYCEIESISTDHFGRPVAFCLRSFEVNDMLVMDDNAYESLQIFKKQFHPSVYKAGRDGFKEGFGLYSVCNRCCSSVGAAKLRRWFLRPTRNLNKLKQRLDSIEILSCDSNFHFIQAVQKPLKQIKSVTAIFNRLRAAKVNPSDWISLYKTINACIFVAEFLKNRKNLKVILSEVDFKAMVEERQFTVKPGIDRLLDEKKELLKRLPELLTEVIKSEIDNLPFPLAACTCVYIPTIGYLIAVPRSRSCSKDGDYEKPGLEFMFITNDRVHYKNETMRQLDAELGDVKLDIKDLESSIMISLQNFVLKHATVIQHAVECAATVDCLISMALTAREYNWVRPELVEENVIDITGSRHPLQELCTAPFVNNSVKSDETEFGKMHVLTGPNACGKSVYLKQVGLLVYLAHIGSFVPASAARIGLVDRICTRLHSTGSINDGMSTFAADVKQVAMATKYATKKSLIIIDEFGKGTLTDVGVALLGACLTYWLERDKCPHVFVSTHLHRLFNILPQSTLLRYNTMKVMRQGEDVLFLYSICEGQATESYAACAASKAGLPERVCNRIRQVCQNQKRGYQLFRPESTAEEIKEEFKR
ncbi:MutS -like protein 5 [Trichinella spiralis]|uniref:MutS-like protein 5 n=1 Tax=Trichinella spiralis TaxID=6334 RepID=A0A0V1BIQ6_TRISP|nr:MutS -like protein 5 [Trichinella spiralis]